MIADLYGAPLDFDETVWIELVERFQRLGRVPSPSNRSQAEVPRGAVVLRNRWGTAPGLWLEGAPGMTIMLPGVPLEMRKLLEHDAPVVSPAIDRLPVDLHQARRWLLEPGEQVQRGGLAAASQTDD